MIKGLAIAPISSPISSAVSSLNPWLLISVSVKSASKPLSKKLSDSSEAVEMFDRSSSISKEKVSDESTGSSSSSDMPNSEASAWLKSEPSTRLSDISESEELLPTPKPDNPVT